MKIPRKAVYLVCLLSVVIFLNILDLYFNGTMNARTYDQEITGRTVDSVSLLLFPILAFLAGLFLQRFSTTLKTWMLSLAIAYLTGFTVLSAVSSPLSFAFDPHVLAQCSQSRSGCPPGPNPFYVQGFTIGIVMLSVLLGIIGIVGGAYLGSRRREKQEQREMRHVAPLEPYTGLGQKPLKTRLDPTTQREHSFEEMLKKKKD